MRLFLFLTSACALVAQEAVLTLPRVGVIDFYGLREVRDTLVIQALGVRVGSPLPGSKLDAEERVNQINRVIASRLEAICCNDRGDLILYVGIEETGARRFVTRVPPGGADLLPDEILALYQQEVEAARRGTPGAGEARLAPMARENLENLRLILRESANELHRAAAAYLLSYTPQKNTVVEDLQIALRDADPGVRLVAIRKLVEFAELARKNPATRIRVSPAWFIEILDSLAWPDKMEAAKALETLTASGDPLTMSALRSRGLDALIEMARWKTPEHALPAFLLVGRVAGMTDRAVQDAWVKGEKERVIGEALKRR